MTVTVRQRPEHRISDLKARMYSPLCGLVTTAGYTIRGASDARAFVAGAQLCGVHILNGQPPPNEGGYHIGGSGFMPFEPEIRVYAEAAERYCGALGGALGRDTRRFGTRSDLDGDSSPVTEASFLRLYDEEHRGPFHPYSDDATLTWIRAPKVGGGFLWVPAQYIFLGYRIRREVGEPWIQAAFSTGTAVHGTVERAIEASLLEIVQIDATMGHWYGTVDPVELVPDSRVSRLTGVMGRYLRRDASRYRFFRLPSADLPGFVVACLRQTSDRSVPRVAVGLGADLSLERAMYKALLEVLGVASLAEWTYIKARVSGQGLKGTSAMFDVDSNVAHYAALDDGYVESRFASGRSSRTSKVEDDIIPDGSPAEFLTRAFVRTGKRLVHFDLTTDDVASLGFVATRLWSPEVLSLAYPSAPPNLHPRFADYGGFRESRPHPYP
ncbi:YcaO-like family protein [Virgisporangium aurantiacum]|uniref:Streptolysin associated protein SagD n=1 Tax=Virgisporangium aurantiacum TaxID=175570 RepID=A0A8J4E6V1_9ACTN|nr:YcaO-like family protein [Virgisporangium aurantiacum]GIJ63836.1 streptolysin associated protein SagD [Virgisporangium aurantiacum]